VAYVSPLRAEARGPATIDAPALPIAPVEPMPTYLEPPGLTAPNGAGDERDDEPPLPDEARQRVSGANAAPTAPTEASAETVLHVRFRPAAGTDRLVDAMEQVRSLLRARPGATRVVIYLPQGSGRDALPMELRTRVAYDADLLAEVSRRLGDGIVELQLA
jgi:hypothetical protein